MSKQYSIPIFIPVKKEDKMALYELKQKERNVGLNGRYFKNRRDRYISFIQLFVKKNLMNFRDLENKLNIIVPFLGTIYK